MNLTNIHCKNAKYNPDGKGNKLSDGGGLYLHIRLGVDVEMVEKVTVKEGWFEGV